MFGLIFNLFHVDLNENSSTEKLPAVNGTMSDPDSNLLVVTGIVPGPPFVFGALLVILALMVAAFISNTAHLGSGTASNSDSFMKSTSPKGLSSTGSSRRHFSKNDGVKKSVEEEEDLSDPDLVTRLPLMNAQDVPL